MVNWLFQNFALSESSIIALLDRFPYQQRLISYGYTILNCCNKQVTPMLPVSILVGLLQFFVYDISVAHLNIEYGKIFSKKSLQSTKTASNNHFDVSSDMMSSVTRSGDLLDFGQLLKAFGNNLFAQISHILRQFL